MGAVLHGVRMLCGSYKDIGISYGNQNMNSSKLCLRNITNI